MDLEPRLIRRYEQLIRAHMISSDFLSAGVKSTLKSNNSFSQTQAAWRFLNNERCTLKELIKPILSSALEQSERVSINYALVAHDWSGLIYKTHASKRDRFGIHNKKELGYELQASLLLSDEHGGPIAPVAINVATKTDVFSTYRSDGNIDETHLEELAKRVNYIEHCGFTKPLVHIVDREGDSAQLIRVLGNYNWLLRSRSNSHVEYKGISTRIDRLAKQLTFTLSRKVSYKGRGATQYLAEGEVMVTRASQPKKKVDGKRIKLPGRPVRCRLIVSKIEDVSGKVIAWWYLLSNVTDVCMADLALWYYWRWSIESFFKLLKSAGMQLESWQQTSGEAIARRLLIACMVCVLVWQIAKAKGEKVGELRRILIRFSGRQMKYGVEFTKPALFAGLCVLLNMIDLLEKYDPEELKHLLRKSIGGVLV